MEVKRKLLYSVVALSAVALFGCGDDDNNATPETIKTYSFTSRFDATKSSVSNSGQTARQVLIADLNTKIASGLDATITSDAVSVDTQIEALAILNTYYLGGTATLGATPITTGIKTADTLNTGTLQTTYASINGSKNLKAKLAGQDAVTDHKVWNNANVLVGFGNTTPDALIQTWLTAIAANTANQALGNNRPDPIDATKTLKLYQSNDGLDLKQLVQKFLLGAITFSQATDDYLDDDVVGKGLLSDNVAQHGGTDPFTNLEHGFDEGFGYFGAARNYNHYTDNEIRGKSGRDAFKFGYNDANGDKKIDLLSEFNFGNSTNAAKRDAGSTTGTDFTKAIFDAFVSGRTIIAEAGGALSDAQLSALMTQRDIVVSNWEKAIAATVVHYINEILNDDMSVFGTAAYSYGDHIKHWGEMKGFSMGFQFNPRSPLNDARFAEFHAKVGMKPVLPNDTQANIDAYKVSLKDARDILQRAYGFDSTDVAGW